MTAQKAYEKRMAKRTGKSKNFLKWMKKRVKKSI